MNGSQRSRTEARPDALPPRDRDRCKRVSISGCGARISSGRPAGHPAVRLQPYKPDHPPGQGLGRVSASARPLVRRRQRRHGHPPSDRAHRDRRTPVRDHHQWAREGQRGRLQRDQLALRYYYEGGAGIGRPFGQRSARQPMSPGLPRAVSRVLAAADLSPAGLVLGVTESTLIEDGTRDSRTLQELKALRFRLALTPCRQSRLRPCSGLPRPGCVASGSATSPLAPFNATAPISAPPSDAGASPVGARCETVSRGEPANDGLNESAGGAHRGSACGCAAPPGEYGRGCARYRPAQVRRARAGDPRRGCAGARG